MDQNNTQIDENNIVQRADKLLEDIKQTNKDMLKTLTFAGNLNNEIDKTIEDFEKTEKELEKFEKDTVNEMDKAVLDFVS